MKPHIDELLHITQYALKRKTYQAPFLDEENFYYAAHDNGLIGLVYRYVNKALVSPLLYDKLTHTHLAFIASDVMQVKTIGIISELFNNHKIDHLFIKGANLKFIYPETYMRSMGDIDILIKEDDMHVIKNLFAPLNIKFESKSDAHDLYLTEDYITIEIHPRLYLLEYEIFQKDIFEPWLYAHVLEGYHYELDPTYELMYLLYHLSKHIKTSGVGLRSLLDIGLFIKAHKKDLSLDLLKELLFESKLDTFFEVTCQINDFAFGLDEHLFTYENLIETSALESLITYIATSGIHGKGRDFNPFESRLASHQMQHKSRLSFYISLLFPSYRTMKGMYPFLENHIWLLPSYWIYRLLKKAIKHTKSSFIKFKKLFIRKKNLNNTKDILKKLGL